MLYDLKADAFNELNHASQENRSRALAHQRLVSKALAGRRERYTNPIPGLLDRLQKLANRESRTTTEPAI